MISLELAQRLRQAGLVWRPAEGDRFVMPDRHMDNQVFVLTAQPALIQLYNGSPVVTFHGSSEWALDYVFLSEALWVPSETQLREALAALLPEAPLGLERAAGGYCCTFGSASQPREIRAADAETAYALALLACLDQAV